MSRIYWLFVLVGFAFLLGLMSGCSSHPVIDTRIVEKAVPVYCKVTVPAECKELYAVDRVSPADDALTINRAMRIEIEERATCEVKLKSAIQGCNTTRKETKSE